MTAPMTREQIDDELIRCADHDDRFTYSDRVRLITAARYGLDLRDAVLALADNSWQGLVSESSIRKAVDGVK